jgi:hypothetical protein
MDNTQYFYRNVIFTRKNNQVSLVDIDNPEKTTALEEWLGIVISLADGQHTIQEMIDYMSRQYQQTPLNLEETLHSIIERLEEARFIQLSKEIVSLPYYLSLPIEELDLEKAKKLISEDGYNDSSVTLQ